MSRKVMVMGLCLVGIMNATPALAAGDPSFDPASYQSQLATLSPKGLDGEYVKKLGAWGIACIPDGLKVGVSGVLETVPVVSLFNDFFGGAVHDLGRDLGSNYMDTFISEDGKNATSAGHATVSAFLGGPLGYLAIQAYERAYNALYASGDSGPIRTGAYMTTRTLAHDSFDANSNSLCRQSVTAISEIKAEMKRRKQNVSQPNNTQQSSVAQKPLFNDDTAPTRSPVLVGAGDAS
jgi:hypothetical protein